MLKYLLCTIIYTVILFFFIKLNKNITCKTNEKKINSHIVYDREGGDTMKILQSVDSAFNIKIIVAHIVKTTKL